MELYTKGLEKYPISSVAISNLLMLIWIEAGAFAFWMFNPIAGYIFGTVGVLLVYIYLRWAVCRHCWYFGKRCSTAWGLISSTLFEKGDEAKFTAKSTLASIFVVYGLLMFAPIIILVVLMLQTFIMLYLYALIAVVVAGFLSGFVVRRKSCAKCKLRVSCPGCAAPLK